MARKPANASDTMVDSFDLAPRARPLLDVEKHDEDRRHDDQQSGQDEDDTCARDSEHEPGERRAHEDRDALDAARDGIRGGELARGSRASAGVSAAWAERNGVVTIAAATASAYTIHGAASRNTPTAAAPISVMRLRLVRQQNALAAVAVREQACEGCEQRGGDEPERGRSGRRPLCLRRRTRRRRRR